MLELIKKLYDIFIFIGWGYIVIRVKGFLAVLGYRVFIWIVLYFGWFGFIFLGFFFVLGF